MGFVTRGTTMTPGEITGCVVGVVVAIVIIGALIWLYQRVSCQSWELRRIWCNQSTVHCDSKPQSSKCDKDKKQDKKKQTKCKSTNRFSFGDCFPKCPQCGDIFYNPTTQATYIFTEGGWILIPISNYADFYATAPPNNRTGVPPPAGVSTSMIFPGESIEFPVNGPSSATTSIVRQSNTQFQVPALGNFIVRVTVGTDWDLLANFALYVNNVVFGTTTPGAGAYYLILNGNFGITLDPGPATIYNPNANPPSLSNHLWYEMAPEMKMAQFLHSSLVSGILSLPSPTIIPNILGGQTLTPGVYVIGNGGNGFLVDGTTLTFNGDGFYFIIGESFQFAGIMDITTNSVPASKIFWLATTNTVAQPAFDIGTTSTANTIVAGTLIVQNANDVIFTFLVTGSIELFGGILAPLSTVTFNDFVPGSLPITIHAASDTVKYAANQVVVRVNGVEQVATRTGNANPTQLFLEYLVSTITSASPGVIDVSVPRTNSNPLQVFRYLTFTTGGYTPPAVTAHLQIQQVPV